jgi:RNA polymerase sigma-70 factor (ECF subfamily)
MADDDLVQRLRAHDSAALAEFLRVYRPQLLAYVSRQLGEALRQRLGPDDILQETAIAALNALPKADLSDRDPFGWLCQIAQQRIIDASRRAGAQKRDAGREQALNAAVGDTSREWMSVLAASITSPSRAAVRGEQHAALERAIAGLPTDVQEVLRWRYVDDLPTKEIAARLGKTDGAVRVLLSRTVQKLQELMEE